MSLEVTLGLLSAMTGNLYAACQYWLQALSSCNRNCWFTMQRQLCCMLLPNEIKSLDSLLMLSQELHGVNASDAPSKGDSVGQLFQHFNAYYCKALVSELWYRCPGVLAIFQCDQDESVEDESEERQPWTKRSFVLGKFEGGLTSEYADASEIADANQISRGAKEVKEGIQGVEACVAVVDERSKSNDIGSNIPSCRHSGGVGKQDLKSVMKVFQTVLLSDHHAEVSNLRLLLTEIRKASLLKRSRQFLQTRSTGKHLNEKKKKEKKIKAQTTQPTGFSINSGEGDSVSDTASGSNAAELSESHQTEQRVGEGPLTEPSKSLVEVLVGRLTDEDEKQGSGENEEIVNECPALSGSLEVVTGREGVSTDLRTHDGRLPIDLRFATSDESLENLEKEEENVLQQLEQFGLKVS